MLCNRIKSDGMEWDGAMYEYKLFSWERSKLGQYVDQKDRETPNVWAYKQRCKVFELNDIGGKENKGYELSDDTELYLRPTEDGENMVDTDDMAYEERLELGLKMSLDEQGA